MCGPESTDASNSTLDPRWKSGQMWTDEEIELAMKLHDLGELLKTDEKYQKYLEEKRMTEEQGDMVNHPAHYADNEMGIECIDAIRAALGKDGFIAFLRGQVIKYEWRLGKKADDVEDAQKAAWYANKLAEVLSEV